MGSGASRQQPAEAKDDHSALLGGLEPPKQLGLWRISHDPLGRDFYWNVQTRETTWIPPDEYEDWYQDVAEEVRQPDAGNVECMLIDRPIVM